MKNLDLFNNKSKIYKTMKTFYLTVKNNKKDIIARVVTETIEQAISYFSKVKKLSRADLLGIYTVSE